MDEDGDSKPVRKIVKARRHLKHNSEAITPKSEFVDPTNTRERQNDDTHTKCKKRVSLPKISPSTSNPSVAQFASFETSDDNLRPSVEGASGAPKKRRTYELEDSVNDISVLKSIAESVPSDEFSNVTTRRRWNKVKTPSGLETPSWLNKSMKNESGCKSSATPHKSAIKMPNFAEIHRRALEKMESIDDYKRRKLNRARMLLSGNKPQTRTIEERPPKCLRFAPGTSDRKKSLTFIPLPSTPMPKRVQDLDLSDRENRKPSSRKKLPVSSTPKSMGLAPITKDKFEFKFASGIAKFNFDPSVFKQGAKSGEVAIKSKSTNGTKVHKYGFKLNTKSVANDSGRIPVKILTESKGTNGTKANKYGFKAIQTSDLSHQTNPCHKGVKSITGNKINLRETQRCAIKGVRSNRRFELLMNMRKGKC